MAEILVINLTRMGDIVQTSPLLQGLRQQHPDAHIALLVIDAFRGVAQQIPAVDEVLVYEQDESVSRLMAPGWTFGDAVIWHRNFVRALGQRSWDLVINLTHSHDSALLSQLVARGEIRGLSVHRTGQRDIKHDWVKYFFNVTANRGFNSFNLVDIYRRIGNLPKGVGQALCLEPGDEARRWAADLPLDGPGPLVMLQLGASRDNRRWPLESFARCARILAEECGARFLLCGTQKEMPLAASLMTLAPELVYHDLSGQTNLAQLSALCTRADLLISNDTGTMHIAAAMGTPVVSLFLATALPEETAAYLPGTLVLQPRIACSPCSHHVECPHINCRDWITPAAVAAAARMQLDGSVPETWPDAERVHVFRCERDAEGFQTLVPLLQEQLSPEAIFSLCYRRLWKTELRAGVREPLALSLVDELAGLRARLAVAPDPALLLHRCNQAREILDDVIQLAGEGHALTGEVALDLSNSAPSLKLLERVSSRVIEIDATLFKREMSHTWLRPLAVLFRFDKEELDQEPDFERTNRAMGRIYDTLAHRALELANMLDTVIRELEPVTRTQELDPICHE
ncbi:MAG: glycosyltransferase family 9 protein [Candidatus Delongbacteria bacterium]|nr:glycosyltransferase family 9 protein [Candidatus Delongbacteria bacterium]